MISDSQLLSPYAPIRYRTVSWWEFSRNVARDRWVAPNGQIAGQLPDVIMHQLIRPLTHAMSSQFAGMPDAGEMLGLFLAKAMELRHWVPLAAQYDLCGRQIFDLTDDLVEMLSETDVGECTLEDWHAPYDTFFVRFGRQESMRVPFEDDFEYLDGAFVGVTPWNDPASPERRIKFGFTTVRKDGTGMTMPGYFLDLTPDEQKLPILEAIDASITRRIADISSADETNSDRALTAHRRDMMQEGATIMKQALSLVINALFYIESTEGKGKTEFVEPGRDTPPDMVVAWSQATPQKRQKLRSKLTSDGYALVRMMGKELASEHGAARESSTVKPHWRRGHWRQQRHGPKLSQVKRVWIKPTMINQDRPHDDIPGHIYTFGSNQAH